MRSDKPQASTSARQKATLIAFVIIVVIIIWQVVGLFRGGSTPAPTTVATNPHEPVALKQPPPPQPAPLPKPAPLTPAQAQLIQLQQQTEVQYVTTVNSLQMLRLQQEIATTNQAIASAQLATVTAQKNIINLLNPPAPVTSTAYSPTLVNPTPGTATSTTTTTMTRPATPTPVTTEPSITANYTVISVSKLLDRWRAVLGFQGSLFQVQVGDVLPPDQSEVISINNSGVVLRKGGETRRVSLVPII